MIPSLFSVGRKKKKKKKKEIKDKIYFTSVRTKIKIDQMGVVKPPLKVRPWKWLRHPFFFFFNLNFFLKAFYFFKVFIIFNFFNFN